MSLAPKETQNANVASKAPQLEMDRDARLLIVTSFDIYQFRKRGFSRFSSVLLSMQDLWKLPLNKELHSEEPKTAALMDEKVPECRGPCFGPLSAGALHPTSRSL